MKRKKISFKERQQIYDLFDGHCAYCGCVIENIRDMQADHVEPLELGGEDEIYNLYPSCRSCNHYKNTLTLEKFRSALEKMPDVLMRDCVTYRIASRYGIVKIGTPKVVFYFEKIPMFARGRKKVKNYDKS